MAGTRPDRVTRALDKDSEAYKAEAPFLPPSPDTATNLLIADIVLRGASRLFRESVQRRIARASVADEEEAEKLIGGKTLLKSLALYGASKLATQSKAGLGVVAGGLALKTLYDRGKAREKRKGHKDDRQEDA